MAENNNFSKEVIELKKVNTYKLIDLYDKRLGEVRRELSRMDLSQDIYNEYHEEENKLLRVMDEMYDDLSEYNRIENTKVSSFKATINVTFEYDSSKVDLEEATRQVKKCLADATSKYSFGGNLENITLVNSELSGLEDDLKTSENVNKDLPF